MKLEDLMSEAKELRELRQEVRVRLKEIELKHTVENKKIQESTTVEDDLRQVQKWLTEKSDNRLYFTNGTDFGTTLTTNSISVQ